MQLSGIQTFAHNLPCLLREGRTLRTTLKEKNIYDFED